jgi:hypothetical protein
MTSAQPAIPDEALFFVAEKYSSVTELLRTLYNSPSQKLATNSCQKSDE